ncbi:MAG: hypothetical protein KDJ87_09650 [Rhizobiaceae bacterium]|nr:hypothetical protein [Rhizobiaceae bacterium]
MTLVFWIVLLSVFLGFFFWATNLLRTEAEGERFDAGLAILEFGKACPNEAIRQVLMSADGEMVFLRLWTGRTGLMRRIGNRTLCHLVNPADVRVSAEAGSRTISITFPAMKPMSGTFTFRSEKEAAEVGLWLLGSVSASLPRDFALPTHA